ncbi:MAG TPA: hypothetical protein VEF71_08180, partial [Streptosporangiaceae bacterium]|nr:hypothetical protein [Streptosporangiaceae bacterium]
MRAPDQDEDNPATWPSPPVPHPQFLPARVGHRYARQPVRHGAEDQHGLTSPAPNSAWGSGRARPIERFWAFPGPHAYQKVRRLFAAGYYDRCAAVVARLNQALATDSYG